MKFLTWRLSGFSVCLKPAVFFAGLNGGVPIFPIAVSANEIDQLPRLPRVLYLFTTASSYRK
jgi:hypothetical protein